MKDYFSREDALKWCRPEEWDTPDERWRPESEYGKMIKALPAADVVERRRGIWLFNGHIGEYFCSECRRIENADEANIAPYCRWCGADMREG